MTPDALTKNPSVPARVATPPALAPARALAPAPAGLRFRRNSIHATTALAAASGEINSSPHEIGSAAPPAGWTRIASPSASGPLGGVAALDPDALGAPAPAPAPAPPPAPAPRPTGAAGTKSGPGVDTTGATASSFVTTTRKPLSALRAPGAFL